MTKFTHISAGLLAAAMLAAVPAQASATHKIGHAIAGGIIGGVIGGAIANATRPAYGGPVYVQPAPVYVQPAPVYVQPGYSPHQAWCINRYRSYNPATDIYFVRPGVPRYCNSPYN